MGARACCRTYRTQVWYTEPMSLRPDILQLFEPGRLRPRIRSAAHLTPAQQKGWGRNSRMPSYIWRDGLQYFSIHWLSLSWSVSRAVVRRWALAHPHLTHLWSGRYLFCRNEGTPPRPRGNPYVPPSVERDGHLFLSMPELAARRNTTPHATRAWAGSHPHLTIRVGKHLYCRDEEYAGPRRLPLRIERDGHTYWSIPELAARRRVGVRATRRWAERRPNLILREDGHTYVRDEDYRPRPKPPTPEPPIPEIVLRTIAARRARTHAP